MEQLSNQKQKRGKKNMEILYKESSLKNQSHFAGAE